MSKRNSETAANGICALPVRHSSGDKGTKEERRPQPVAQGATKGGRAQPTTRVQFAADRNTPTTPPPQPHFSEHEDDLMRLTSTFNPLRGCDSDLPQYSHTPILPYSNTPSLRVTGFEHEDSLPDVAPRFALPPAQSRPRKRGTLHKGNVGGVGRTILGRLARAPSTPRSRGVIRTWRNTPTLQYSITPRGRIRRRGRERSALWTGERLALCSW